MTVVSCHHKPTPTINKLGFAARGQTMIYCSLQINKSITNHCESRYSFAGVELTFQGGFATLLKPLLSPECLVPTQALQIIAKALIKLCLYSTTQRAQDCRQKGSRVGSSNPQMLQMRKNQGHVAARLSQCTREGTPLGTGLSFPEYQQSIGEQRPSGYKQVLFCLFTLYIKA